MPRKKASAQEQLSREEKNGLLIPVIIDCVEALQKKHSTSGPNFWYIINQSIRQYQLPAANVHVTEKALKLWERITDEDMGRCFYRERVRVRLDIADVDKVVESFSGNGKTDKEQTLTPGNTFIFNSIFLGEHTTPVLDIVLTLLEMRKRQDNRLSFEDVRAILEKIHVTKMLKTEEPNVKPSYGRLKVDDYMNRDSASIFQEIICKCYHGIRICK